MKDTKTFKGSLLVKARNQLWLLLSVTADGMGKDTALYFNSHKCQIPDWLHFIISREITL